MFGSYSNTVFPYYSEIYFWFMIILLISPDDKIFPQRCWKNWGGGLIAGVSIIVIVFKNNEYCIQNLYFLLIFVWWALCRCMCSHLQTSSTKIIFNYPCSGTYIRVYLICVLFPYSPAPLELSLPFFSSSIRAPFSAIRDNCKVNLTCAQ